MSDTKRNALAELAERLSNDAAYLYGDNDKACEDVLKAQRIVAELAKVGYLTCDGRIISTVLTQADRAIINCRAIAEEGVNNGQ